MRASEHQRGGLLGFLRACRAAAWLEYRNLRYYPSNLVLAAIQELTAVGVWYFVGRFLNAGASEAVQQYGGNYLAYVVIGVLLNQVCLAALGGPFTTMSEAFWDKRLETYRLSVHGIWANLVGRLGWQVLFSTCLQLLTLLLMLLLGGVSIHASINWPLVLCAFLLLCVHRNLPSLPALKDSALHPVRLLWRLLTSTRLSPTIARTVVRVADGCGDLLR